MEFDLHGHTNVSRLDGIKYSPTEAVKQAKELGLDGIAINDHDTLNGIEEALEAGKKYNIVVIPGVEIITRCGIRFPHLLALGLTPRVVKGSKIPTFGKTGKVIEWVHHWGGVAIAVHPRRNIFDQGHFYLTIVSFSLPQIEKLACQLDGVEVCSPYISVSTQKELTKLAEKYNLAQLRSSDFHKLDKIGLYRTKISKTCSDWETVIKAIKNRQIICS